MPANVDLYSGFVYDALDIPTTIATPLFATARLSGWCAHRIEELISGGKLMRPAYKSVQQPRPCLLYTSVPLATLCRNLDLPFPAEILTGNGSRAIDDILHRTLCDQFSSVDPGLRTYINDMIRSIHAVSYTHLDVYKRQV